MPATRTGLSPAQREARLRQPRSANYVASIAQLDAGGHVHGRARTEALLEAISQELPDIALPDLPAGIVARCRLGAPYEVHTLDRDGSIVRHFKNFETLPPNLEKARNLALHPAYAFVEVYRDQLICVAADGSTSVVPSTS